jgi:MerR family transcriptional regulator, thiopeptide resistance regulator
MLKVGELAALAKLTVRTLHHYDDIGLLRPSARSDAGYRLYSRDDVARLHRIQALRAFGMSLADVGLALDSPDGAPLAVVDRQLAALERQRHEIERMHTQLLRLRGELAQGRMPDLSTWITTLENMTMYQKYFTEDELARLPMASAAAQAEWQALVEQASSLIAAGVQPQDDAAQAFALRWLQAFERDTGGDPAFMARLNVMALREKDGVGMPAAVLDYVLAALTALKRNTWAKYLRPEVIARMRTHQATRGHEWAPLIEQAHAEMKADPAASGATARALARQWMDLFHDMVGTDPADIEAFRRATANEALLRMGSGIGDPMLAWLRRAMAMAAPAAS